MKLRLSLPNIRLPRIAWRRRVARPESPAAVPVTGILGGLRTLALALITGIVTAASAAAFAESYHGLYVWAARHGYSGFWVAMYPLQVDSFIVVGELALVVAMTDRWSRRDRGAAWMVAFGGLAASVAGNIGHIGAADLQSRGTAAVPPMAAFAALWVGLGVLKRVVERRHVQPGLDAVSSPVPTGAENAAVIALRATLAAGNPLSLNQVAERFSLTRAQATKVRQAVLAEANGHNPE